MARGNNGTGTIGRTGTAIIDGVLSGYEWTATSIQYSFPTLSSVYNYNTGGRASTFSEVSSAQKTVAQFALDADRGPAASAGFSVEGFTNLNISRDFSPDTTSPEAIRFANTTTNTNTAVGYYPSSSSASGDTWYNDGRYESPTAGNYAWHTHIHEVGHALGLKHSQDTGGSFGPMQSQYDHMEYTVMAYRSYEGAALNGYTNETWGYAQSYMMADIAGLQAMYGADFTTNSGNTVYKWNPNSGDTLINGAVAIDAGANRIFATIWDGGGKDTYDLTAYSNALDIDLRPGESSKFSQVQTANLNRGTEYAEGNIYNALQYNGDTRSLIEDVKGGSGSDRIVGNEANNRLEGRNGNDTIYGKGGNDTLVGGNNNDRLYGDNGNDRLYGDDGNDRMYGGNGNDRMIGGRGNDTMYGQNNNDSMDGWGGNDKMYGQNGNDRISGQQGQDIIRGGSGNDVIRGGADKDVVRGESGADVFVFKSGDLLDFDTLSGSSSAAKFRLLDVVEDFVVGVDTIVFDNFSGVDSRADLRCYKTNVDGDLHFTVQVRGTNERVLVDAGDNVSWGQFFNDQNFDFV